MRIAVERRFKYAAPPSIEGPRHSRIGRERVISLPHRRSASLRVAIEP